ncbi:tRNA (adenosine(37)-N6)-dimethylallyltransferase MiaA [Novacetimonas pomaceti]|uniref:tRNA (adenosine(37)-N6)-dimethylallyltransferase MiaA n=1 Tax=Novacetimonas pomaceti TaxID=2021998 RepID=UPI001EF09756|nr:tRNA (adenosine(37)-N6)-dimethylallyltransferase MiaA [Novacetimonas pomaceti]
MTQGTGTRQGVGAPMRPAVIVAGPTCSGKSALALALARTIGGTVINADSMQVYRELRILTARPGAAEEALLPHRLYGVVPAARAGSVAWWRKAALSAAHEAWEAGRIPVFCGGTGMYFRALTEGLADIPDPPPEIRAQARAAVLAEGGPAIHARLMQVDPETASALRPGDTQRIARAWEVWRATGRGLSWWRAESVLPPLAARFVAVRLSPPRDVLRRAIAARFDAMMESGAVEEVRALLSRDLSPALPAMRAHGVPEIAAMLRGGMSREQAVARAVQVTAQYTKRQSTWFAHHALAPDARTLVHEGRIESEKIAPDAQQMESEKRKIISFVINCIDAGDCFA